MSGLIAAEGAFHRLRLPVLTFGSSAVADVTLADLAEIHCVIAPTPAGPTLRSFQPETTRVNGVAVAATMLKHGDIIEVGPHSFTLAWHGHNLESEVQRILQDLSEREQFLQERCDELAAQRLELDAQRATLKTKLHGLDQQRSEQEEKVEAAWDEQQAELDALRANLEAEYAAFAAQRQRQTEAAAAIDLEQAEERERLMAVQAEVAAQREAVQQKQAALDELEAHILTRAEECFVEARQGISEEQTTSTEAMAALQMQREQLQESERKLMEQYQAFRAEADAANVQIAASWSAVAEAHEKTAHDRAVVEAELARQADALEARRAAWEKLEAQQSEYHKEAQSRLAALQAELAALEPRVAEARAALAELNQQRAQKPQKEAPRIVPEEWAVPLVLKPDGRTADQLIVQLRQQEIEVGRERQRLAAQLHHIATEREQLNDQRALVADQIRGLELARRQWKDAEAHTLAELEQLAQTLAKREAELDSRTHANAA